MFVLYRDDKNDDDDDDDDAGNLVACSLTLSVVAGLVGPSVVGALTTNNVRLLYVVFLLQSAVFLVAHSSALCRRCFVM